MNKNITNTTVSSDDDTLVRVSLNFMGDKLTYDKYLAVALSDGCIVVSDKQEEPTSGMWNTTLIDTETNQVFIYKRLSDEWMTQHRQCVAEAAATWQ